MGHADYCYQMVISTDCNSGGQHQTLKDKLGMSEMPWPSHKNTPKNIRIIIMLETFELSPVQTVAAVIWEKSSLHLTRSDTLKAPLSELASAPHGSDTDANTHTPSEAECVFAHAALGEEETACNERMPSEKMRELENDDDDGRQYPTYQKRLSSLVSDSDSVGGTKVMCRTEARWGKEGWGGGKERKGVQTGYSAGKCSDLFQDGQRMSDGRVCGFFSDHPSDFEAAVSSESLAQAAAVSRQRAGQNTKKY